MASYHVTDLMLFAQCEQRYHWAKRERLQPRYDGIARPVGRAVHVGIERLYLGANKAEALEAGKTAWQNALPIAIPVEERAKVEIGRQQVERCIANYPYSPGLPAKIHDADFDEVVSVEEQMQARLPNGATIIGTFDRRVRIGGFWWLHDTKTTGLAIVDVARMHRVRMQYPGYCWIAHENDIVVEGVLDEIIGKAKTWKLKDGSYGIGKPVYHRESLIFGQAARKRFVEWAVSIIGRIEKGDRIMNTDACYSFGRICPYLELCASPGKEERLMEGFNRSSTAQTPLK